MTANTCTFQDCDRPVKAIQLCNGHTIQHYKGQELRPLQARRTTPVDCVVTGCESRARNFNSGQHLCSAHHQRWKKYGDAAYAPKVAVRPVALSAIADAVANRGRSGCWTDWEDLPCWEGLNGFGGALANGYPMIGSTRVMHLVMEADGRPRPAPPNNFGRHDCDTPACWNPSHLRWGSHEDNMSDRTGKLNYCQHCAHCNP